MRPKAEWAIVYLIHYLCTAILVKLNLNWRRALQKFAVKSVEKPENSVTKRWASWSFCLVHKYNFRCRPWASRTRDRSRVHIKFQYWWALLRPDLCLSYKSKLNERCQSTVWALHEHWSILNKLICGLKYTLLVKVWILLRTPITLFSILRCFAYKPVI